MQAMDSLLVFHKYGFQITFLKITSDAYEIVSHNIFDKSGMALQEGHALSWDQKHN